MTTKRFNNNMNPHKVVLWHIKAAGNIDTMRQIWLFWKQKLFNVDYEKNSADKVVKYAKWCSKKEWNYEM